MKKILFLGGSYHTLPAVKLAKSLGYYVITLDYKPSNISHKYSDRYYNLSTKDVEAVLKVAIDEEIDGILAYASEPAAITAAYVASIMRLPSASLTSVETLSHKDKFRTFQLQ